MKKGLMEPIGFDETPPEDEGLVKQDTLYRVREDDSGEKLIEEVDVSGCYVDIIHARRAIERALHQ